MADLDTTTALVALHRLVKVRTAGTWLLSRMVRPRLVTFQLLEQVL